MVHQTQTNSKPKKNFRPKFLQKISEFRDDRDMIQTQVEKIIDVDEKNGKL